MSEQVKVCTTIEKELHERITEFNKTAERPLNMAQIMRNSLIRAAEEI